MTQKEGQARVETWKVPLRTPVAGNKMEKKRSMGEGNLENGNTLNVKRAEGGEAIK